MSGIAPSGCSSGEVKYLFCQNRDLLRTARRIDVFIVPMGHNTRADYLAFGERHSLNLHELANSSIGSCDKLFNLCIDHQLPPAATVSTTRAATWLLGAFQPRLKTGLKSIRPLSGVINTTASGTVGRTGPPVKSSIMR